MVKRRRVSLSSTVFHIFTFLILPWRLDPPLPTDPISTCVVVTDTGSTVQRLVQEALNVAVLPFVQLEDTLYVVLALQENEL